MHLKVEILLQADKKIDVIFPLIFTASCCLLYLYYGIRRAVVF